MLFTLSDKYEYLRFSRIDVTYIYLIMTFLLIDLKVFSYYLIYTTTAFKFSLGNIGTNLGPNIILTGAI